MNQGAIKRCYLNYLDLNLKLKGLGQNGTIQNSHMHAQRVMMCGNIENRKINNLGGGGSLFHA